MKPLLALVQRLSLPFTLTFMAGCSGVASHGDDPNAAAAGSAAAGGGGAVVPSAAVSSVSPAPRAPVATVPPELPDFAARDRNGNRIDDELERARLASVEVQVILLHPAKANELAAFARFGGKVSYVFSAVSYGWGGWMPRANLTAMRNELGSGLHFIAAPRVVVPLLDEATRTGRVRAVWPANFAGSAAGFLGNANITIGVIDTGVDDTHLDLAKNSAGFQDFSTDAVTKARDVQAHGTHVTSIAVGSGAAFGVGPGTLQYTNSGDLTGFPASMFNPAPIHTPGYFNGSTALTVSSTATWVGGTQALLRVMQSADGDGTWAAFGSMSGGVSPQSLFSVSISNAHARYSDALTQGNPAGVTKFAVANSVANYPAVGDGFNALSGVAPKCLWFGAKVFTDQGYGNSTSTGAALDFLVNNRVALNVKVVNLSLGALGGTDENLRGMVNTAVDHGLVVVVSGGNGGPGVPVGDPGRAGKVITVGATNDLNELTSYSSPGSSTLDNAATETPKPDLLAPGGSSYRSLILAADSNSADAEDATFADVQANDYRGQQGTSMSAPFVAGASALLIDALQQSGVTWDFSSNASAFRVKSLLLASATETNKNREQAFGGDPTLGRADPLMDLYEGYGILNPDAAIEAITLPLPATFTGTVNNGFPARPEWERRAWGRRVSLHGTDVLGLTLNLDPSADFDLYVYSATPDKFGDPVLRASSTNSAPGVTEKLQYTASVEETAYVFVKRVSGFGDFTLTATHLVSCGNGVLDPGEFCDPAIPGSENCCDASCRTLSPDTQCDDGNACSKADHCLAGACVAGDMVQCAVVAACQIAGQCNPQTGQCSPAVAAPDDSACALGTCQLGVCRAAVVPSDGGASGAGAATDDDSAGSAGLAGSDAGSAGVNASAGAGSSSDAGSPPSSVGGSSANSGANADAGCGCSAAGSGQRAGSALWVAAALTLLSLRRRRASAACKRTVRH